VCSNIFGENTFTIESCDPPIALYVSSWSINVRTSLAELFVVISYKIHGLFIINSVELDALIS